MIGAMDTIPPEGLLDDYPEPMRRIAETLRVLVRDELPDAVERVRIGWRLIAYHVPAGPRRTIFSCYIALEPGHVHLGFPHGVFMRDAGRLLEGAGVTKNARWLTFRDGDPIPRLRLEPLVREGARVARLTRGERLVSAFERDAIVEG